MSIETRQEQIERLYPDLLRLVASRTTSDIAADIVHDVVVHLLQLPKEKQTTDSWIMRLAVNRALNKVRDDGRRAVRERGFLDVTHGNNEPTQLESLLLDESLLRLNEAFKLLPNDDAMLIFVHYFWEFSQRKTAEFRGLSKSTVNSSLARIRAKLRENLQ